MKRLAIIGSSDLGQQIAYHSINDRHYEVVGFFDDFKSKGFIVGEIPVIGKIGDVQHFFNLGKFDLLMVGIGYKYIEERASLFEAFVKTIPFASIIHSSAYIDSSCKIGKGVIIYPGCVLDMNVVIEDNVLLNTGCVIAHDSTIGRHSFLSPAVKIAGFVKIANSVNLGIGTTVIDNININEKIKTGAGAVVVNNLVERGLYTGLPAKMRF